jgi:hypothetical protein
VEQTNSDGFALLVVIGLFLWLIGAGLLTAYNRLKKNVVARLDKKRADAAKNQELREAVQAAIGKKELVDTESFEKYHYEFLSQARISFWFSIISASFGFCLIVFAALTYMASGTLQSVVQFLAGFVIDAVSVLFFTQSQQAKRDMNASYKQLQTLRLIEGVKDERERAKLISESIRQHNVAGLETMRSEPRLPGQVDNS